MSNAIDLCQVSDVRAWLNFLPAQAGSSSLSVVSTTIAASISAGQQTVTPASMAGIYLNSALLIDTGTNKEYVVVSGVTGTTFSALFGQSHSAGVTVTDQTDAVIGMLITSASMEWLRRTGRGNADGSIPSQSPYVQPVSYNEWYDGSGGNRQFLYNSPITAVSVLTIENIPIPASSDPTQPGYVVDQTGKSIVLRSPYGNRYRWSNGYPNRQLGGLYYFNNGVQNINVQYTAGYTSTPWDVTDAVVVMVATNYKRRSTLDQASNIQPQGAGTTVFRSWELEPKVISAMQRYSRTYSVV